jgi:hypothetical protein
MYGRQERCNTGFSWEYLRERNHLKDLSVDGIVILRRILKQWDGEAWTGLNWLRIRTGGGHL